MLNDDINRFLGVFSFPFSNLDFIKEDYLDDYYQKTTPKIKDKAKLRDELIKYINKNYTIYTYDQIYLYLDKWYLYPKDKCTYKSSFDAIFDRFKEFSKCFISQRNGKIVYKYWENENDKTTLGGFSGKNKIYLFHSLNRLIPLDLLSIIYMIGNNKKIHELDGFYGNIIVSDSLLDNILENGVAENHLHCGVSASFLTVWEEWMKPLTEKRIKSLKKFEISSTTDLSHDELKLYIWYAGLLRISIILATKINDKSHELEKIICNLKENSKQIFDNNIDFDLKEDCFIKKWNEIFSNVTIDESESYIKQLFKIDNEIHTSDENIFLYKTIEYLQKTSKNTKTTPYEESKILIIKKLFLDYLRIKNFFYKITVQQKTIHGLDFFQIYYHANSTMFKSMKKLNAPEKWERIIREQIQNSNLKKLELRTSLDKNENDNKIYVLNFLKAYLKILKESFCKKSYENSKEIYKPVKSFPKIALVFHLLKKEQEYHPEKCILEHEINNNDNAYVQYGELYQNYKILIENLKSLRQIDVDKKIFLDKYIVGLDVASLENAVPTWVFAPIYQKARGSEHEPLCQDYHSCNSIQSLGFTFHAGEDFRHILSGLRRIYEVVQYLKFHAGDRIGHGIALGISPAAWYKKNATVILPRIEALENYLLSYHLLSQNFSNLHLVNIAFLEKKIHELSTEIYTNISGVSTNMLVDSYLDLFRNNNFENGIFDFCKKCILEKCESIECNLYNKNNSDISWDSTKLIYARNCKNLIYKMNEPIHYEITDQEINIATEVQRLVRDLVNKKGIIIEINPSSNIVISDIDTMENNQVFGINGIGYDLKNTLACINSDDPSVFNTNVSNELAYIYFSMIEKEESRENILAWIEKLRVNGMNASFIKHTNSDEEILSELEDLCENL